VTVSGVLPTIVPLVAVMLALPAETAVARPITLIVAAAVFVDLHVTAVRT
jgi:hypothetical protein